MQNSEIIAMRMRTQGLAKTRFDHPVDAVRWLTAVQSQDYPGAKWGIAQRVARTFDLEMDQLFAEGAILRTHVMRPTWHLVLPEDTRWMLKLTSPRVHAVNAYYYRSSELDAAAFARSSDVITWALQNGNFLTRDELATTLRNAGIIATGLRLVYILMHAELDALICSGPMRGKQFTYALLDERAPAAPERSPEEALAELTWRYFTSHGPATIQDVSWWSGLTIADVKRGGELNAGKLEATHGDGNDYWHSGVSIDLPEISRSFHLLPNYDDYLIAYKNRDAAMHPDLRGSIPPDSQMLMAHFVTSAGLLIGGWRRSLRKKEVVITLELMGELTAEERADLEIAIETYSTFLGLPVRIG